MPHISRSARVNQIERRDFKNKDIKNMFKRNNSGIKMGNGFRNLSSSSQGGRNALQCFYWITTQTDPGYSRIYQYCISPSQNIQSGQEY